MFVALLGGTYAAYKHFSGLDPLKLDPQAVFNNLLSARTPQQFKDVLSSFKLDPKVLGKVVPTEKKQPSLETQSASTSSSLVFKFLLVADSHNDNDGLTKAISQAVKNYPDLKFIIGLGDYTDTGTIEELKNAKKVFDSFALRYFLIPGDHDLWDCRNRGVVPVSCFKEVFGPDYQAFTFENIDFLLVDNSDNYTGFSKEQSEWITQELEKTKQEKFKGILVFMHEPLYHPSSDHVMGWVEKNLKPQAGGLIFQLKDASVSKVFAGDIHYFSDYTEPKTNLPMVTVGAAGIQRNPQTPRFAVVSIFEDGSNKVEDVEIK
ncbi:metallophosphoesterase [Patescibacteria group bacterium]|nr:metallophosphoesterase [Patescibacteria group bacterium]